MLKHFRVWLHEWAHRLGVNWKTRHRYTPREGHGNPCIVVTCRYCGEFVRREVEEP